MLKYEYKRVLFTTGNQKSSLESMLNELGEKGWELVIAVNLESGTSQYYLDNSEIEYVFKRNK